MTIGPQNLKILKHEIMLDVDEGGGLPTAIPIIDGKSNEMVDDVSDIDALLGKVKLRKVSFAVDTETVETLQSGRVIFTKLPENDNISVFCFQPTFFADRRKDAQNKLESYLAYGPRFSGHVLETQLTGQMVIQQSLNEKDILPYVGQSLVLVQNEGLADEFYQYLRVEKVETTKRSFQITNVKSETRVIADIYLSDSLKYKFDGLTVADFFNNVSVARKAILREARIADAAKYYSATKLTKPVTSMTTRQVEVESIFTQVVPGTQVETPIVQNDPANQQSISIKSSDGKIIINQTETINVSTGMNLPSGVLPGSLIMDVNGKTLTDSNGELVDSSEVAYASIKYDIGQVTWYSNTNWGSKTVTGSYFPATSIIRVAQTDYQDVGTNAGYNFIRELTVEPAPGSLKVSYQVNNTVYTAFDNGKGNLVDIRGAGRGTIRGKSIILTTEAIPDSGSKILYSFGVDLNSYSYPVQDLNPAYHIIPLTDIFIGEVQFSWDNKTAKMNNGVITGDATGNYIGSEIHFSPKSLVTPETVITVTYQKLEPVAKHAGITSAVKRENGNILVAVDFERAIVSGQVNVNVAGPNSDQYDRTIELKISETGEVTAALINRWAFTTITSGPVSNAQNSTGTSGTSSAYWTKELIDSVSIADDFQLKFVSKSVDMSTGKMSFEISTSVTQKKVDIDSRAGLSPVFTTKVISVKSDVKYIYGASSWAMSSKTAGVKTLAGKAGNMYISLPEDKEKNIASGSLVLDIFSRTNVKDSSGILMSGATKVGEVNYTTGIIGLSAWTASLTNTVKLKAMMREFDPVPLQSIAFRTPIAPLKKESFSISVELSNAATWFNDYLIEDIAGLELNLVSDSQGNITGSKYAHGKIDFKTGFTYIYFYMKRLVSTLPESPPNNYGDIPWYDPANKYIDEDDGLEYINHPIYVKPDTLRYNAMGYKYMPLDSSVIGLDPVRLPSDGRVQFLKKGDTIAITELKEKVLESAEPGKSYNLGFKRLSDVSIFDNDDVKVDFNYLNISLDEGVVILNPDINLDIYSLPLKAKFRIMDIGLVLETDISGIVTLSQVLTHDYTTNAVLSSMLLTGNLQARVGIVFAQKSWTSVFSDNLIGDRAESQLQIVNNPIVVTNSSSIKERWALIFSGSTSFRCLGETVGEIGVGTILSDFAPLNPMTGKPYFKIPKESWGTGYDSGNTMRINTYAAIYPVWFGIAIQQHQSSAQEDYNFTFDFHGNINRDR